MNSAATAALVAIVVPSVLLGMCPKDFVDISKRLVRMCPASDQRLQLIAITYKFECSRLDNDINCNHSNKKKFKKNYITCIDISVTATYICLASLLHALHSSTQSYVCF